MSKVWNLIFGLPLMHERWNKGGLPLEMASRKAYPCFACRDKGFDNVMVLLDGKDSEGKTKYLNEDGTRHTHQGSSATQPQPKMSGNQTEQASSYQVSDESVDRGISAFSMMTDLIRLVEQTQKLLVTMDEKLDRLLNLAEIKR